MRSRDLPKEDMWAFNENGFEATAMARLPIRKAALCCMSDLVLLIRLISPKG